MRVENYQVYTKIESLILTDYGRSEKRQLILLTHFRPKNMYQKNWNFHKHLKTPRLTGPIKHYFYLSVE